MEVDVPHFLEIGANDLFGDAGPPVEVQGGELLRRVLTGVLHVQVDDLGLGEGRWMRVNGPAFP